MDSTKHHIFIILLLVATLIEICSPARILCVFPVPFREHQIIYRPLFKALVDHGHTLVIMTTDPVLEPGDNVTQIDLSFTYKLKILENLKDKSLSGSEMLKTVFETMRQISNATLASDNVQELMRDENQQFDAVIVEWSGTSVMNALAYKYGVPLIGISSGGALINSHEAFGNPTHPIAYPNVLLPFTEDLNLFQRIASVLFTVWYRWLYYSHELPQQNAIAQKYFGPTVPDLWQLETSADLLLINKYQSLGNVRPSVPSTIFLGGIHSQPQNQLPTSLDHFLATSVNGAVYINLGTIQSRCISERRLETLLYAVSKLKLDIVWNCDVSLDINSTTRIYHAPDMYQEDILAHPTVKIFITNGGQRNIEDAIHNRVPVLGVSYSSHVEHYLRQIEKHNAGIVSFIDFDTHEMFTQQIADIIDNKSYRHNIEKLNNLIRDQPMAPVATAIWWIEYTIRNKGTSHLQSTTKHLGWFQYLLLDVIITFSVVCFGMVALSIYLIDRLRKYSNSLPIEMVTRGSRKAKCL